MQGLVLEFNLQKRPKNTTKFSSNKTSSSKNMQRIFREKVKNLENIHIFCAVSGNKR